MKRCVQATRPTSEAEADVEAESDHDSLPDRLINPGKYEPLLPTTEEQTAAELTEDKEPDNEKLRRLIPVYTYGSINWLLRMFFWLFMQVKCAKYNIVTEIVAVICKINIVFYVHVQHVYA